MLRLAISAAVAVSFLPAQDKNLVEVAVGAGQFKTLVAAVKAADLVDTLAGDGPFTVFAPTDDAFAALPEGTVESLLRPENKAKLQAILLHHVVAARATGGQALQAGTVEMLDGNQLAVRLEGGRLRIGDSSVVANDIEATNGIIHVIDSVLLPPVSEPATPQQAAAGVLTLAIDRGVPLFNDGNIEACAAVYEIAVFATLANAKDVLREDGVRALQRAVESAEATDNPRTKAWAFRRGMDGALRDLYDQIETGSETVEVESNGQPERRALQPRGERVVFGFDDPRAPRWTTLNDEVMGGISKSEFVAGEGYGTFRGALSLENNGGFATIRSPGKDLKLGGFDGLELRVRGDGRQYYLSALPSDARFEMRLWRAPFRTRKGEWQTVRIPFASLRQTFIGREVRSGGIPAEAIRSLSFSISDKDETPFELQIDSIRAYREGASGD